MSARRLSVVQQVHHQEAPTGGAVHVSCPPAGRKQYETAPVRCPSRTPYPARPASNIPVFYPDDSEIENLDVPPVTNTQIHTPTHARTSASASDAWDLGAAGAVHRGLVRLAGLPQMHRTRAAEIYSIGAMYVLGGSAGGGGGAGEGMAVTAGGEDLVPGRSGDVKGDGMTVGYVYGAAASTAGPLAAACGGGGRGSWGGIKALCSSRGFGGLGASSLTTITATTTATGSPRSASSAQYR